MLDFIGLDRQNAAVWNGLTNRYMNSCYRPEALGDQCTFFALMFSGHLITYGVKPWIFIRIFTLGQGGGSPSLASGWFWLLWWQPGTGRRQQEGIVSTSDSQLKGCTVWQADRENW